MDGDYFGKPHYLGSIFQVVGIESECKAGYLVGLSFARYLFVYGTFLGKLGNVLALNIFKIDLCCCISCICQYDSCLFHILEDAIFHE